MFYCNLVKAWEYNKSLKTYIFGVVYAVSSVREFTSRLRTLLVTIERFPTVPQYLYIATVPLRYARCKMLEFGLFVF